VSQHTISSEEGQLLCREPSQTEDQQLIAKKPRVDMEFSLRNGANRVSAHGRRCGTFLARAAARATRVKEGIGS